jgi:hypothetical protein
VVAAPPPAPPPEAAAPTTAIEGDAAPEPPAKPRDEGED